MGDRTKQKNNYFKKTNLKKRVIREDVLQLPLPNMAKYKTTIVKINRQLQREYADRSLAKCFFNFHLRDKNKRDFRSEWGIQRRVIQKSISIRFLDDPLLFYLKLAKKMKRSGLIENDMFSQQSKTLVINKTRRIRYAPLSFDWKNQFYRYCQSLEKKQYDPLLRTLLLHLILMTLHPLKGDGNGRLNRLSLRLALRQLDTRYESIVWEEFLFNNKKYYRQKLHTQLLKTKRLEPSLEFYLKSLDYGKYSVGSKVL